MMSVMKRQKLETSAHPPPLPNATRMYHSSQTIATAQQQQQQQHMHYQRYQQLQQQKQQQRQFHQQQQLQQKQQQQQQVQQQHDQQPIYSNGESSSYATLQQQLHYQRQQQQLQQQQQHLQQLQRLGTNERNISPTAMPQQLCQTSLYNNATSNAMMRQCARTNQTAASAPKRRYEHMDTYRHQHHLQQPPQSMPLYRHPTTAASTAMAATYSPVTLATTGSPIVTTTAGLADSPPSLPGISTMLRRPHDAPHRVSPLRNVLPPETARTVPTESLTNVLTSSSNACAGTKSTTTTTIAGSPSLRTAQFAISCRRDESLDALERRRFSSARSNSSTSSSSSTPRGVSESFADHCGIKCDDTNDDDAIAQHDGSSSNNRTIAATLVSDTGTNHHDTDRIANPNKNSRYLREMDRRQILSRIDAGEKQATLAKEYQVSRAAICNLNKHRVDVMSRSHENPLAKHPKKPRPKTFKLKIRAAKSKKVVSPHGSATTIGINTNAATSTTIGSIRKSIKSTNVHEVKTRAAALLLTRVRDTNTPLSEFARSSERLVRLVLEEALARVPIQAVDVVLSDRVRADGVAYEHPPCAISLETHASPLLDVFRTIEPDQPTARVRVRDSKSPSVSTSVSATLEDTATLPASLQYHNVFLLELVAATTADAICCALRTLLQQRGAVESMISVVVLFVTTDVVRAVRTQFPSVRIVAAQIDPSGSMPQSPLTATDARDVNNDVPPCCLAPVLDRFRVVYT